MGGSHFFTLSTRDKPVGRLIKMNSGTWFTLQANGFHQNKKLMKLQFRFVFLMGTTCMKLTFERHENDSL